MKGEVDAVDTMKLGTYKIVYKYTDAAGNVGVDANRDDHDYVMRIVTVVDTTAPELTVIDPNRYQIEVGTEYVEKGYKAIDNIDGDITDKVVVTYRFQAKGSNNWTDPETMDTNLLGTYRINYTVTDSSGNVAEGSRVVEIVDTTAPEVTSLRMLGGTVVDGTLNGKPEKVRKATNGDTISVYASFNEELGTMPTLKINDKIEVEFTTTGTYPNGERYYLAKYTIVENDGLEDGPISVVITGYEDASGNKGTDLTNADMTVAGQREIIIEKTTGNSSSEESVESTTDSTTTSLEGTIETEVTDNGNAEVTLKTTKPAEAPEGWEKVNDTTFKTTLPEGEHSVDVEDSEGNESTVKFSVEADTETTEEVPSTENVVEAE